MKLIAIPFRDAFPKFRWAQHEIFDDYLAVIPAEGRADTREYNRARRANLKRVLELAIEELASTFAPTSSHSLRCSNGSAQTLSELANELSGRGFSNPRKLLARLKRIQVAKVELPRSIRVRYCAEIRTYRSRNDDTRVFSGLRLVGPIEKSVKIQDVIDFGLRIACECQPKEAFELETPNPGEFHDHGLV